MDILIQKFINLINKVEETCGHPIKIIAFDFDCTLIPFHTHGAYPIYGVNNKLNPNVIDKFFPNKEWIQYLFISLVEYGKIPAITSHSDQRFVPTGGYESGYRGGVDLILPLMDELIPGDIFKKDNIIAYSNENDGTFDSKNQQIKDLVNSLNKNLGTDFQTENVLLIDDTFNNIIKCKNFQSIFSDFQGSGLSFGAPMEKLDKYFDLLNTQLDKQIEEKYGLTINNKNNYLNKSVKYLFPALTLIVLGKIIYDKY